MLRGATGSYMDTSGTVDMCARPDRFMEVIAHDRRGRNTVDETSGYLRVNTREPKERGRRVVCVVDPCARSLNSRATTRSGSGLSNTPAIESMVFTSLSSYGGRGSRPKVRP